MENQDKKSVTVYVEVRYGRHRRYRLNVQISKDLSIEEEMAVISDAVEKFFIEIQIDCRLVSIG